MPFLTNAIMAAESAGAATLQLNFDPSQMFNYTRRLRNATDRINTAFFVTKLK